MSKRPVQVIVGSKNQIKVGAVKEALSDYLSLAELEVVGVSADSSVSEQPLGLEEIVTGAKNRATAAYQAGSLSIGLESGLIEIPLSDGEYMDVCMCSVYDGDRHHLGMSCGFRLPREVVKLILSEGLDLNQAMYRCGITEDPELGSANGSIGLFTKNRICRKDYCKQSLLTALISIENSDSFPDLQTAATR